MPASLLIHEFKIYNNHFHCYMYVCVLCVVITDSLLRTAFFHHMGSGD